MIDVMSLYQFAHQVQGEQMAVANRARGLVPQVKMKKMKKGKKNKGEQTGAQPSANPLDFTSTYKDNPMYDMRPDHPMGDTFNPVERAKMRRTASNAQAFDAHINERLNEFRNGTK